jgi:hypothetical protein
MADWTAPTSGLGGRCCCQTFNAMATPAARLVTSDYGPVRTQFAYLALGAERHVEILAPRVMRLRIRRLKFSRSGGCPRDSGASIPARC